MSHNTILFDMNSIGHAAHAGPRLTSGELEVQAIFSSIRTVRNFAETYPGWRLWCLWDGDKQNSWRRVELPEYKENREATDPKQQASKDSYKKQAGILRQTLPYLGLKQMMFANGEADDCAGHLVPRIVANGGAVVLVSGDQDWLQLVRKNVIWVDPIRDRRVSEADFLDKTGYHTPFEFLQGKALQGDSSDNIPGVGGIGEKGALDLLAKYGSVEKFFAQWEANPNSIKGKKLNEFAADTTGGRGKFERNMRLMNLIAPAVIPPASDIIITQPKYNEESFKRICERLAFASFLRDFERFIKPFRQTTGGALLGEAA